MFNAEVTRKSLSGAIAAGSIFFSLFFLFLNGAEIQSSIGDYIAHPKDWRGWAFTRYLQDIISEDWREWYALTCAILAASATAVLYVSSINIWLRIALFVLACATVMTVFDVIMAGEASAAIILNAVAYNVSGSLVAAVLVFVTLSYSALYFGVVGRAISLMCVSMASWMLLSFFIVLFAEPFPIAVRGHLTGNVQTEAFLYSGNDEKPEKVEVSNIDKFRTISGESSWEVEAAHPSILFDVKVYQISGCMRDALKLKTGNSKPILSLANVKNFSVSAGAADVYSEVTASSLSYEVDQNEYELKSIYFDEGGSIIYQFAPDGFQSDVRSDVDFSLAFTASSFSKEDAKDGEAATRIAPPIVEFVADGVTSSFTTEASFDPDAKFECRIAAQKDKNTVLPGILIKATAISSDSALIVRNPFKSTLNVSGDGSFIESVRTKSDINEDVRLDEVGLLNASFANANLSYGDADILRKDGNLLIKGRFDLAWGDSGILISGVSTDLVINGHLKRETRWSLMSATSQATWWSALGFLLVGFLTFVYRTRPNLAEGFRRVAAGRIL